MKKIKNFRGGSLHFGRSGMALPPLDFASMAGSASVAERRSIGMGGGQRGGQPPWITSSPGGRVHRHCHADCYGQNEGATDNYKCCVLDCFDHLSSPRCCIGQRVLVDVMNEL